MKYAAISDRGMLREKNEDFWNIVLSADGSPQAFIVADGMGGHEAGDVASRMAVEAISKEVAIQMQVPGSVDSPRSFLEKAILHSNEEIYQYAQTHLNGAGAGTTLTAGVLHNGRLIIAHIGDSSLYLIRNGVIEKITRDHSYVGELVEKGVLDAEEARTHPLRNQITRALGYEKQVQIDFYEMDTMPGDIYLFCTDGLTLKITQDELMSMLDTEEDLEQALKQMVALANRRGGEDNITAIAVKI